MAKNPLVCQKKVLFVSQAQSFILLDLNCSYQAQPNAPMVSAMLYGRTDSSHTNPLAEPEVPRITANSGIVQQSEEANAVKSPINPVVFIVQFLTQANR
jgi:hypothetical protein